EQKAGHQRSGAAAGAVVEIEADMWPNAALRGVKVAHGESKIVDAAARTGSRVKLQIVGQHVRGLNVGVDRPGIGSAGPLRRAGSAECRVVLIDLALRSDGVQTGRIVRLDPGSVGLLRPGAFEVG